MLLTVVLLSQDQALPTPSSASVSSAPSHPGSS